MCEIIEKNRIENKLSTLVSLVLDGQLSTKDAAAKASVSISYFEAYKQGFAKGRAEERALFAKVIDRVKKGDSPEQIIASGAPKEVVDIVMTIKD